MPGGRWPKALWSRHGRLQRGTRDRRLAKGAKTTWTRHRRAGAESHEAPGCPKRVKRRLTSLTPLPAHGQSRPPLSLPAVAMPAASKGCKAKRTGHVSARHVSDPSPVPGRPACPADKQLGPRRWPLFLSQGRAGYSRHSSSVHCGKRAYERRLSPQDTIGARIKERRTLTVNPPLRW
jgi:hypothetical protein